MKGYNSQVICLVPRSGAHRYTQVRSCSISAVIPAWMPESSHRDVNLWSGIDTKSSPRGIGKLPSLALDSGIHAGMTGFVTLVYYQERSGVGIHPATLQLCGTLERHKRHSHRSVGTMLKIRMRYYLARQRKSRIHPKVIALGKIAGDENKSQEGIAHFVVDGEHYLLTANEMSGTVESFKIVRKND